MSAVDPVSGTRLEPFAPAGVATRPESIAARRARGGLSPRRTGGFAQPDRERLPALGAAGRRRRAHGASLLGGHPRFARTLDGALAALRARGASVARVARRRGAAARRRSASPSWTSRRRAVGPRAATASPRSPSSPCATARIADVFETLVNPERSIPPFITRLTNISWEMVRDKAPFRDVCDDVLGVLDGHVFVAHNAALRLAVRQRRGRAARGRELTGADCALCASRDACCRSCARRSLDWVARHYGVEIQPGTRHRAAGDALATAHCLLRLLDDAREPRLRALVGLERFLAAGRRRREEAPASRSGHAAPSTGTRRRDASARLSACLSFRSSSPARSARCASTPFRPACSSSMAARCSASFRRRSGSGRSPPTRRTAFRSACAACSSSIPTRSCSSTPAPATRRTRSSTTIYGIENAPVGASGPRSSRARWPRRGSPPADVDARHQHPSALRSRGRQHDGGARTARRCSRFPNARYVVRRGEWDWAHHTNERTAASYFAHNYDPAARRRPARAGRRRREIAAGHLAAPHAGPHAASSGHPGRVGR